MQGRTSRFFALAVTAIFAAQVAEAAAAPEGPAAGGSKIYQKSVKADCSDGKCAAVFPRIPNGKILETTNLSCLATGDISGIAAYAALETGSTVLSFMPLAPYTTNGRDGLATGALAGTIFIDGGKQPVVTIIGGPASATCTLSGRLVAD